MVYAEDSVPKFHFVRIRWNRCLCGSAYALARGNPLLVQRGGRKFRPPIGCSPRMRRRAFFFRDFKLVPTPIGNWKNREKARTFLDPVFPSFLAGPGGRGVLGFAFCTPFYKVKDPKAQWAHRICKSPDMVTFATFHLYASLDCNDKQDVLCRICQQEYKKLPEKRIGKNFQGRGSLGREGHPPCNEETNAHYTSGACQEQKEPYRLWPKYAIASISMRDPLGSALTSRQARAGGSRSKNSA